MPKSVVAVVKTKPETFREDYHRLLSLAGYETVIDKTAATALKTNLSSASFYPASSTTPWQLDGVIDALVRDGYAKERLFACQSRAVVVDARVGERENKHLAVVNAHRLRNVHLDEGEERVDVRDVAPDLTTKLLCLNEVFPQGFSIPKRLVGANIIHLPTMKTDAVTTIAGAMQNALGLLASRQRHWTHPVIHEALADLLLLQKRVCKGVFAVMDGTFAGDGPGPRSMIPYAKDVIVASSDLVAIDAVAAKLMGLDPIADCKFIRLASELGLGVGNAKDIEIVGDVDVAKQNWHFDGPFKNVSWASTAQTRLYRGPWKRPATFALKSRLAPWAYAATVKYDEMFGSSREAKEKVSQALASPWARLFATWGT